MGEQGHQSILSLHISSLQHIEEQNMEQNTGTELPIFFFYFLKIKFRLQVQLVKGVLDLFVFSWCFFKS